MPYIIVKSSRRRIFYNDSDAYSGPSCDRAGVLHGHVYASEEEALVDARLLTVVNPVGFTVVEIGPAQPNTKA